MRSLYMALDGRYHLPHAIGGVRRRRSSLLTLQFAFYKPHQTKFLTMTQDNQRVLIIGGGIGGLCLAEGLKRQGIPFTVFERDPSVTFRSQGFRLRIDNDGYNALEACLSTQALNVFTKTTAEFVPGFRFVDAKTAEPSAPRAQGRPQGGPEVRGPPRGDGAKVFSADRLVLRSVLLLGLTEDELRYNMAFKSYTTLENGLVEAEFENGERVTGGLLVGAEGTYSRVRRQYLPNATQLLDTDGRAIYGKTPLTPELEAALHPSLLRGTSLITNLDPHVSLFMETMRFTQGNPHDVNSELPDTNDYVYWVLISRSHNFRIGGYTNDEELLALKPPQAAALAREVTKDWDSHIQALFRDDLVGNGCSYIRVSTMSPDIKDWDASNVTLMGDAIHAMTPAGVGANAALMDAHVLLNSIQTHGVSVQAVAAYEAEMRVYARDFVAKTAGAGHKMYGQPGFQDMKPLN
ncbi:hypothetical protein Poli38472_013136 [Pythium oligandrum]|uniref:FAD-binding domain-containing protein n=1 Tax=Pythium oligandrum TaxID=41045 RepID=A0A8K1F9I3_PYTOL|nr:hypothetical protein Poli38472_013136 [Pythium oligandrum]|eukprot:TMW55245.1 hypothetical protein Poli38472_013136 [Pythium oligandrum]